MSQWQNPSWYQQNPQNQSTAPVPVKSDQQQYTYQIPAQAVAYGRPYVPSEYDLSKVNRGALLIPNTSGGMQGVQYVGAMQPSAGSAGSRPLSTGGGTGVALAATKVSAATAGGTGVQPGTLHSTLHSHAPAATPAGLTGLPPVSSQQVGTAPVLGQHQPNSSAGLLTPQYMQVPVQPGYPPHPSQIPGGEYSNYQGTNFQLHPDQWSQLAVGLRKPTEVQQPAPQASNLKRKPSKASSTSTPISKESSAGSVSANAPNVATKITKRSRMGCLTCRLRKKRCCESKPKCTECLRLGLNCVWPKPGTEHKNKPKEVKREENMIDHDVYGKIKVLRGIVEYRSN